MKRRISVSVALAITLIAMTVTFSVTMVVSMNLFDLTVNDVTEKQAFYSKIAEIDTYVRGNFFGDISDDTLYDAVAVGFINGLDDPYSSYYTAEEYAYLQDVESGKLVSIGLVAQKDASTGYFRIVKVFADSPAATAGMEEGTWITAVDGTAARNITGSGSLNRLLRGEQGTTVTIETEHIGLGTQASFEVQRINYTAPTVEFTMLESSYAYIRIYSFSAESASDFDYAVQQAQNQGAIGLVFDLRGTSTGYIENSYDMIDTLCPRGTIAKTLLKSGVKRVQRMSDENSVDLPMVCLVNENTGGAGELFAACVRDLAGGQLVGSTTAGRGSLQARPYQLSDGSAIVLTYAQLYTGDDEGEYTFDGVGLTPDIEIAADALSDTALYTPDVQTDNQLLRALELVRSMARATGGEQAAQADSASSASNDDTTTSAVSGTLVDDSLQDINGEASTSLPQDNASEESAA